MGDFEVPFNSCIGRFMVGFSRISINMFNRLPPDVVSRIFEYDSSHHEQHRLVCDQIKRFNSLIIIFSLLDAYPDGRLSHRLKAVARATRKHELKSLCVFLRLSVPRKVTKYRLSLRLFSQMSGVSFSYINRHGTYIVQPHNKMGTRFI